MDELKRNPVPSTIDEWDGILQDHRQACVEHATPYCVCGARVTTRGLLGIQRRVAPANCLSCEAGGQLPPSPRRTWVGSLPDLRTWQLWVGSLPDLRTWQLWVGSLPDLRTWQLRRIMPPEDFLGDLPFPPPLHSGSAPYSTRFTPIDSQDLDVKSLPNISTSLILLSLAEDVAILEQFSVHRSAAPFSKLTAPGKISFHEEDFIHSLKAVVRTLLITRAYFSISMQPASTTACLTLTLIGAEHHVRVDSLPSVQYASPLTVLTNRNLRVRAVLKRCCIFAPLIGAGRRLTERRAGIRARCGTRLHKRQGGDYFSLARVATHVSAHVSISALTTFSVLLSLPLLRFHYNYYPQPVTCLLQLYSIASIIYSMSVYCTRFAVNPTIASRGDPANPVHATVVLYKHLDFIDTRRPTATQAQFTCSALYMSAVSNSQPGRLSMAKVTMEFTCSEYCDIVKATAASLLDSKKGGPGSIPGWVTEFSHVGIVLDDSHWPLCFLGDLPFATTFHSGATPYSPESPSSALKTTLSASVLDWELAGSRRCSIRNTTRPVRSCRSAADKSRSLPWPRLTLVFVHVLLKMSLSYVSPGVQHVVLVVEDTSVRLCCAVLQGGGEAAAQWCSEPGTGARLPGELGSPGPPHSASLQEASWLARTRSCDGEELAGFLTPWGHFEWHIVPFGVNFEGHCLSRILAAILQEYEYKYAKHLIHIQSVLEKVKIARYTVNSQNIVRVQQQVKFL
ncbi:hypothetical protein PR048_025610 [Dryococelus australis]|uniref:Uncharacterized protein n=1 Tax=Dryococelus australis TaxID=614101 RepID=A0ABQ9GRS5_9NEOP|nr:hypothetical protein PR048_025610 [Dryococelus australis]